MYCTLICNIVRRNSNHAYAIKIPFHPLHLKADYKQSPLHQTEIKAQVYLYPSNHRAEDAHVRPLESPLSSDSLSRVQPS